MLYLKGGGVMPHFGLIDEYKMQPHEASLMRARLHVRSGMRRLRQGMLKEGLLTLYDALYSGMRFYILSPDNKDRFDDATGMQRTEEMALHEMLRQAGVVDGSFDFESFFALMEQLLDGADVEINTKEALRGYDKIMTQLGVMPFDESALPPEDPTKP
jgi:hypothetical protein